MKKYIDINFEITDESLKSKTKIEIIVEEKGSIIDVVIPKPYKKFSYQFQQLFKEEFPGKKANLIFRTDYIVSVFDYLAIDSKYKDYVNI